MGDRTCILAVDDELPAQYFYERMLRKYGDVVVAKSVAEARLQLAAHRAWGAVILDRLLGDGSGLDLLPEIRRTFPSTPVLILSGHVEGLVVNTADDFDADVLSKPLESKRLHRWIERALALSPAVGPEEPAALREPIASLRRLFARKPADVGTRYAIGEVVAALKADPMQFGNRAVTIVGNAVGQDETNLYRHARVAERWSREQFDSMTSRRMTDGRRPSWWHFVMLASVDDDALSVELFERALCDCMTVSYLASLVEQHARPRSA